MEYLFYQQWIEYISGGAYTVETQPIPACADVLPCVGN